MKKPIQMDDSMAELEWERARRVLATSPNVTEASNILEEDPTRFYRRRRKSEGRRTKWKSIDADEAED